MYRRGSDRDSSFFALATISVADPCFTLAIDDTDEDSDPIIFLE